MKRTNLDMTQSILSSLGSDEVNSVSDNPESLQVLECIRTTYFNMIARAGLTNQKQLVQLDPSLDVDTPVLMYVPEGIKAIKWLKYFNNNTMPESDGGGHDINVDITPSDPSSIVIPGYEYVTILPIQQFIDMVNGLNPSESDVFSFNFIGDVNGYPGNFNFYYKNNKQPQYCTIISDKYVIFDSYDSAVDDTLQSSKTMCEGTVVPVFLMTDSFIPNLPEDQFPLLLNEAKSLAFFEMKQSPHPKADQEARRQWSHLQKGKSVIDRPTPFDALPNFGRRGYSNTSYFKSRGWDRS